MVMPSLDMSSPLGRLTLVEEGGEITRLLWEGHKDGASTDILREGVRQLEAYFDGELKGFDLPLNPKGNAFSQKVFAAMSAIPFGQTRTYGDIAKELGSYGQPVGQACGANPIPIIIPCHRVVSANGLGGFSGAGGVEHKIELLKHEGGFNFLL